MPGAVILPEAKVMYSNVPTQAVEGRPSETNSFHSFFGPLMEQVNAVKENPRVKAFLRSTEEFMNTLYYQLFSGALLMLSLFMADSWVLGNAPDSQNNALYATLLGIFIYFCIEVILMAISFKKYFLNFFFWMDVLGTFSIVIDIAWIANTFIPSSVAASQGGVLRATRAARLGARYGRLLRLLRLVRLLKTLPCFQFMKDTEEFEPTLSSIKRVSEALSNELSLRIAMMVLIMVIIVPFLSVQVTDYSPLGWVTTFKTLAKNESTTWYEIENFSRKCYNFYVPKQNDLIHVHVESPWFPSKFVQDFPTRSPLRKSNVNLYDSFYYIANSTLASSSNPYAQMYLANAANDGRDGRPGYVGFKVALRIDSTRQSQEAAMFSILTIILVLVMLIAFTSSFNGLVTNLVIQPLERMMRTLRNSAMVMIKSMKAMEAAQAEEEEKKSGVKRKEESSSEDDGDEDLQTAKLEIMVEKLARIVKSVLPNSNEIKVDENVDKTTANWLNQSYTTGVNIIKAIRKNDSAMGIEMVDRVKLESMEAALSTETRAALNTWDFDVLKYSKEELTKIMSFIFTKANLLAEFKVEDDKFNKFLNEIFSKYIDNTYHNFRHGCDVCFTSYRLLVVPQLTAIFTPLEMYAVLVGALAHDVGHPGLNNLFLVKAKHELALVHNDRSPLENMHCVVLYEILAKEEFNIFSTLEDKQWRDARKIILTIILGTDMSHHFEQINKTQVFYEVNGEDVRGFCSGTKEEIDCLRDEKNRLFIMELVLHCSDISNPFKPYDLCAKWADLVVEEFCMQGDKEKAMGLEVSPMCDRDQINLCNMQMGFIEFVVAPLIIAFVNILPPLHEIGSNMLNNYQSWGEKRKLEIMNSDDPKITDKPEECRKVDERLSKFKDKLSFINALKELPRRRRNSEHSSS